jgi:hypothetical protein
MLKPLVLRDRFGDFLPRRQAQGDWAGARGETWEVGFFYSLDRYAARELLADTKELLSG